MTAEDVSVGDAVAEISVLPAVSCVDDVVGLCRQLIALGDGNKVLLASRDIDVAVNE